MRPLGTLALILLTGVGRIAEAQVVRGTVTERTSGQPVIGVLVTLELITGGDSSAAGGAIGAAVNALSNATTLKRTPRPPHDALMLDRGNAHL